MGKNLSCAVVVAVTCLAGFTNSLPAADSSADLSTQVERGKLLYLKNCFICHRITGEGMPGAYPPLAKSDFLMADRERSIRIGCEGLSGEIIVNGKKFNGTMAVVTLSDQEVADVFTYVRNAWGNKGDAIAVQEVKDVRAKTEFRTYEALLQASTYPPLPQPPEGFTIREVVRLPVRGVRMASDGHGNAIFVLSENGDVHRLTLSNGQLRQVLWGKQYLEKRVDDIGPPVILVGMTMDQEKRLYIAANQLNGAKKPIQNIVTIYRTPSILPEGDPAEPKPWFQTAYPGSPAMLHGVENLQFG